MAATPMLTRWKRIPAKIRAAIRRLGRRQLDLRGGSEGWTIREHVHHLVEANVVASTIVLAAIGKPGCTYDWSWLIPDGAWMRALGYDRAPVGKALELLDAVTAHVATLLELSPGHMRRHIYLLGTDGRKERFTVAAMLAEEVSHASHHLADIAATRREPS